MEFPGAWQMALVIIAMMAVLAFGGHRSCFQITAKNHNCTKKRPDSAHKKLYF
jgi:hypothetical protein